MRGAGQPALSSILFVHAKGVDGGASEVVHEKDSKDGAVVGDAQKEQLTALRATNNTLTAHLQDVTLRFAEERAEYRARIKALEAQNVLLLKARSQEDARYDAIAQSIKQLKVRS